MFGFLTKEGLFNGVEGFSGDGFEQGGGGDFERGAAGESASEGDGGMDESVEPARVVAASQEAGDDAERIIKPGAFGSRFQRLAQIDEGAVVAGG